MKLRTIKTILNNIYPLTWMCFLWSMGKPDKVTVHNETCTETWYFNFGNITWTPKLTMTVRSRKALESYLKANELRWSEI